MSVWIGFNTRVPLIQSSINLTLSPWRWMSGLRMHPVSPSHQWKAELSTERFSGMSFVYLYTLYSNCQI
jgi:hypothetical protein